MDNDNEEGDVDDISWSGLSKLYHSFFLLFIHCQVKVNKWIKSTLNSRAKIIGSVTSIWSLMFVGVYSIFRLVSLSGGQSVIIQLDQDFCTAIFILLGNFAVLLSNFKFQTIIWPWKSLKPEKWRWWLFWPGIQDFEV